MKRLIVPATLLFFMMISLAQAGIHGTGMGGIKTVTSEGPADISRNPALLGTMTADKALALFATARAYTIYDTEIDAETSLASITSVESKDNLYLGGSLLTAYAFKSGSSSYGISLEGYEGNLFSWETSTTRYNFSAASSNEDDSEKISFNPAINMAMAWHSGDNRFWGFQVIIGNNFVSEEEDKDQGKTEKTSQKHTIELGLGYTVKSDTTQIGILLRSGTFSLEKKYMKADFQTGVTDSNSTEYWPKYDKGIQVTTGAYTKINEKTGIAMEFGYRFPVTFVEKNLVDDNVSTVYEDTIPVSSKGAVLLNGGVEYILSDTSNVNTGLGYQHYSAGGRDDGSVNELSLSVLLWTIGYNLQLTPGSELSLLLITFRQKADSRIRFEDGTNYFDVDAEDTRYAFEMGGGITYTF